jgi:hypothetical protein
LALIVQKGNVEDTFGAPEVQYDSSAGQADAPSSYEELEAAHLPTRQVVAFRRIVTP